MKNKINQVKWRDVQDVLYLIGGRWRGAVLASLCDRPRRFNELKRDLGPVTAKTLIKELRLLEENFLVVRQQQTGSESSVVYELSEHGQTLEPLIDKIQAWARTHRSLVMNVSKEEPAEASAGSPTIWPAIPLL